MMTLGPYRECSDRLHGAYRQERAPPPLVEIDGQSINVSGIKHAVSAVIERLSCAQSFMVCTLNLDHLVKRRSSLEMRLAYSRAEIVTADGFPISLLSRIIGVKIERATGADLIEPVCDAAADGKLPIFLFGTTLEALCASSRHLAASRSGLEICGVFSPAHGFNPRSKLADEAIQLIRESGARICFIALGAPLQELFAVRALEETSGIAYFAIGASLDYLAGTELRCPFFLRKMNLEWAWRLVSNPRRLWRRYLRCSILFFVLLFNALLVRIKGAAHVRELSC